MIYNLALVLMPLYQFVLRFMFTDIERENLFLRQQIIMLKQRRKENRIIPTNIEKLILTATGSIIRKIEGSLLAFKPKTLLLWHRQLIKRKWNFTRRIKAKGRPPFTREIIRLVVRLARENRRWGYGKIQGEMRKLGILISETSIFRILAEHGLAPVNRGSQTWKEFITQYKEYIVACDFFTVDTVFLKTFYVLFFIHISTRRIYHIIGTQYPKQEWVIQQARNLLFELNGNEKHLIHDRDSKFSKSFDNVFISEGIAVIKTPFRSPQANAFAERWVRSVRDECLNHTIILNEKHLRYVLKTYQKYYNFARPHQGLQQEIPYAKNRPPTVGTVVYREYLGGLLKDYYREAAA